MGAYSYYCRPHSTGSGIDCDRPARAERVNYWYIYLDDSVTTELLTSTVCSNRGRIRKVNQEMTSAISSALHNSLDVEATIEPVPQKVVLALAEFERLAEEAASFLAQGELFPGLSSLTGLAPVVGVLRDYCIARVVHQEDETPSSPPAKSAPIHHGMYL